METIKTKLRKIAALAERGVGGERENAKRLLETLMMKHGLHIEDIIGEAQERKSYWFKARSKTEKEMLFACCFRATNTNKVSYWEGRGDRKGQVCFELTKLEALELRALWDHFGPLWRKEVRRVQREHKRRMELLGVAFAGKHRLYSGRSREDEAEEGDSLSEADMLQLGRLMRDLEDTRYVGTRRMLEGA